MNKGLACVIAFSLGAAIGSVATWKVIKTKYEQIAREEIESVKEVYSEKEDSPVIEELEEPVDLEAEAAEILKKEKEEYEDSVKREGYTDYSSITNPKAGDKEVTDVDEPYVISPDEFGDQGYETEFLSYYADGVLADDADGTKIEDIDGTVGSDNLEKIGLHEPDLLHVRNDALETDYEISVDTRKYVDAYGVYNIGPRPSDDE